jgi:hypothetical protein
MRLRVTLVVAAAVVAVVVAAERGGVLAHKTVNSKYTFNKDVRPILQRRCGQCHVADGVAPTPLQSYEDARSHVWPITQTLISGRMPPWYGEPGNTALKHSQGLSARELDILLTWAAGGTPEGPAGSAVVRDPPAGAPVVPDLVLGMPAPFVLESGREAADHEVTLTSEGLHGKWIRAATVIPGNPRIVRRAEIVVRSRQGDQVVGLWLPGDPPQPLESGAAFLVPDDGSLVARMHYRRPAGSDPADAPDQSRIGLFFSLPALARSVKVIDVTSERRQLERAVRVVGVRPVDGPEDAQVRIDAVTPGGVRQTLVRLTIRRDWPRRYVLARPVALQSGSWIEVRVTPRTNLWRAMTGGATDGSVIHRQFRAALEVVD